MKRYKKLIVAGVCLALAFCFGAVLVGCGEDTTETDNTEATETEQAATDTAATEVDTSQFKLVEPGKLTIGSDLDYKPMEYLDGETPAGFSVGLMEEICDRIGLECNYLAPQAFDTLITQVAAGTKMDVAVSSFTINDERLELVDFSDPYYESNQAIVVLNDSSIMSRDDLSGKTLGAQSGTTGEEWIKENVQYDEYIPYQNASDGLAALRSGKIDAFVYDSSAATNHVANEYSDCKILDEIPTGEEYGIAINKDNTALTEAINNALSEMYADGTMDELKAKWIEGTSDEGESTSEPASDQSKDEPGANESETDDPDDEG